MKILLPINGKKIEDGICPSFGRAPYFLLWDEELKDETVIVNEASESTSGAGIQAAQAVVDLKPDVVIAPRMGKNSADVINGQSIKIYKSVSEDVQDNIEFFFNNKLGEMTDIHPGFHQKGTSR